MKIPPKSWWNTLQRLRWRFDLKAPEALDTVLGAPYSRKPIVHVVGTNGKGTTATWLSAYLFYSGWKTGLSTSPHLTSLRERFRVNGHWIPASRVRKLEKKLQQAASKVPRRAGRRPTYFETTLLLGALWMNEEEVDVVVQEAGLGGRLDATNIHPKPWLTVITPLGRDHEDVLGKGIRRIAAEKAAVIRPGVPVCTVQTQNEALKVIVEEAKRKGAPLWIEKKDFDWTYMRKRLIYRQENFTASWFFKGPSLFAPNAALVVAAAKLLALRGVPFQEKSLQRAFKVRVPGRFERFRAQGVTVILDGAHNPPAAAGLARAWRESNRGRKAVALLGFLKDKAVGEYLKHVVSCLQSVVWTVPPSPRGGLFPEQETFLKNKGIAVRAEEDWEKALQLALREARRKKSVLLVTGSLYLVGAVREKLLGEKGLAKIF